MNEAKQVVSNAVWISIRIDLTDESIVLASIADTYQKAVEAGRKGLDPGRKVAVEAFNFGGKNYQRFLKQTVYPLRNWLVAETAMPGAEADEVIRGLASQIQKSITRAVNDE